MSERERERERKNYDLIKKREKCRKGLRDSKRERERDGKGGERYNGK